MCVRGKQVVLGMKNKYSIINTRTSCDPFESASKVALHLQVYATVYFNHPFVFLITEY